MELAARKPNLCASHFQANETSPVAKTMCASRTLGFDRCLAPVRFKFRACSETLLWVKLTGAHITAQAPDSLPLSVPKYEVRKRPVSAAAAG